MVRLAMVRLTGAFCTALVIALAIAVAPPAHAASAPVEAGPIVITEGHARAVGAMARSGAGYLTITNTGEEDDRLLAAQSPAAERVELHDHVLKDGIARMVELEDGIPLPAGETASLEPGGRHLMFMGLREPWGVDEAVVVTLVFERAGAIPVTLALDHAGHHHPPAEHNAGDGQGGHGHAPGH